MSNVDTMEEFEHHRPPRTRMEQVRDLIMLMIVAFWVAFGALSVFQIFRDGSKVLESLPPFWFWGIPLAPFTALYAPWSNAVRAVLPNQGNPPEPPTPPQQPGQEGSS